MTNSDPKKYRSPYRDIDLATLRSLCDLHPWSFRKLAERVGIEPNVLSMVFSGDRPLPGRIAKDFLQLVGMRLDGSLDPEHAFVFVERPGREKELDDLLARIYPKKAGVARLNGTIMVADARSKRVSTKVGRAFFDGRFAVVVHGGDGLASVAWEAQEQYTMKDYATPDVLLSTTLLPTKRDILKAFAESKFPMQVTWDDVLAAFRARRIEPAVALELAHSLPIPPEG